MRLLAPALALVLAGRSLADVWVVDPQNPHLPDRIQDAIDAAKDGDSILVRSGSYSEFEIPGKALSLTADFGAQVRIDGTVFVRDLPAGRSVLLAGLVVDGFMGPPGRREGLNLQDNQGAVHVSDCKFACARNAGDVTAIIADSAQVFLRDCEFSAVSVTSCGCQGTPAHGTHALVVRQSKLVVSGSALFGRSGGDGEEHYSCFGTICTDGGNGGDGLRLEGDSFLYAAGSHFDGGDGGQSGDTPCETCKDGVPGDAVALESGSEAYFLDCTFVGPVNGSATFFSEKARVLDVPYLLTEQPPLDSATVTGDPGEVAGLLASFRTAFFFSWRARGVLLVGEPLSVLPLGTIPAGGELTFTPPALDVPAGSAQQVVLQATLIDLHAPARLLSNARTALVVDANPYSDCNGNGIPDEQDLAAGTSQDADLDGIPDECEAEAILYVDDDAPADPGPGDPDVSDPDEDGSFAHPFDSLQEAADAVGFAGYEIVVRDGLYTGNGNREVDFYGKNVHLHSEHGAQTCVIDVEGGGAALVLSSYESEDFRIEGFTITGASGTGAVAMFGASPRIRDCRFVDNDTNGVYNSGGTPWIERCVFARNKRGIRGSGSIVVRNCLFVENTVAGAGAGIYLVNGTPEVRHCTFVRNRGNFGGALSLSASHSGMELDCNHNVFWGNTAIKGPTMYLSHAYTSARVSYCDVEGGQGSFGFGNGTLHWGAGNIDLDPRFADWDGGDFHLTGSSPCVDAGDPAFVPDPGEVDLDGDPRVLGPRVDMGADEF